MLATAASGRGNILLNIGPSGDGSIPEESVKRLKRVGEWMKINSEAIFTDELFDYDMHTRGSGRSEWTNHGPFTASGNNLYLLGIKWMGSEYALAGLETKVKKVSILGGSKKYKFNYENNMLRVRDLPETPPDTECTVLKIECEGPPVIYRTGGMRVPRVPHPHYDAWPSDIKK